jgi:predicted ATPase/DNA-binding SARP family transcriptional activator
MVLDIRLLGTVQTFRDGTRVEVKGLRQQTFLAYLALTPGSPRHLDGIVAALWPNDAPLEPRQTVQTYASRLRAVLGTDAIVARGGGYVLAISPAEVDASRFETLLHQAADQTADPQRRLNSLSAALALWQGPALEGLVLDDWARGPAVRWSEMRASAEDERAEVLIDLERAADAVADLEAAAWRSPLRERTHSLLMTALHRSGRQAEALRSFHDYRRRLATDLGLNPGKEITLLERSIAAVESALAPTGASIGGSDGSIEDTVAARRFALNDALIPHNLPHVSTSFIGRVDELHAVRTLMEHVRLTTLTGAGGCGKTRLAIAAATASIPQYPGGAWWVGLATTSTDDQVANAVALALRIPLVGGADPVEQVENHLRRIGHALLVLDNAEHVLDAVARLAHAVLEGCPLATLMITSREPLGIAGEHVWRTPSLAAEDASALFRDRAHEGRGDVPLDDDLVRTICQRLDGMPLAIELAAARTRSLSLERIVTELAHVFRVLTGGARTAVARQQTLLASITWSYDLLDEGEQTVLRRLSVFEAPFLLETAEEVTADENTLDRSNVLEIVCHLVDKSLVQFDPTTGRYRLLETVRQFCSDRLDASHETASTRARHAAFYGRFARGIGARMRGLVVPDDVWLELADLFSALRWAYLASPVDAYRICGMNRVARVAVGYLDEMNEQLDWLVTRDGREAPGEWAVAMVHLPQEAILILSRDDLDGRIPDPRSSIGDDDLETQWWQLYAEGQAAIQSGGTSTLEAALSIANANHDDTATLTASSELALNTAWCGRFDLAQSALATTTRYLERLGQPFTSDTAGSGHAAAMFLSIRQGRLADAMACSSANRPDNAFLMFLSAIQIAWLGYAVNDVTLIDTAARWVGRSLPPILRGLSGFVGLLRGLTLGQPADLDTVRAWFDDMGETPICRSQVVVPMVSEYLARGELADARTVAADYRRTADAFAIAPLHRAIRHQIDAIIAYSERDHQACGAACRNLIGLARTQNFALLMIDGLELLALSNTVSAEDMATLLGAVYATRETTGYRGRWPSYAMDTLDATNAAVENCATAFRYGTTMTLEHLVSFIGLHAPREE